MKPKAVMAMFGGSWPQAQEGRQSRWASALVCSEDMNENEEGGGTMGVRFPASLAAHAKGLGRRKGTRTLGGVLTMKRIVTIATAFTIGTAAATAGAHGVTWLSNSASYDNGSHPSVALSYGEVPPSGSPMFGNLSGQMEVHQGSLSDLWEHPFAPYAQFGGSVFYTNGFNASIASGHAELADFVEVHQSDAGSNPQLWYQIGKDGTNWSVIAPIGQGGVNPYVTAAGGNLIAEVHQGQAAAGPLWFDVGYPTITVTPDGSQIWSGVSQWLSGQYNSGAFPSASIQVLPIGNLFPYDPTQFVVIEVHQAAYGYGPLWSAAGVLTVRPNGWTDKLDLHLAVRERRIPLRGHLRRGYDLRHRRRGAPGQQRRDSVVADWCLQLRKRRGVVHLGLGLGPTLHEWLSPPRRLLVGARRGAGRTRSPSRGVRQRSFVVPDVLGELTGR